MESIVVIELVFINELPCNHKNIILFYLHRNKQQQKNNEQQRENTTLQNDNSMTVLMVYKEKTITKTVDCFRIDHAAKTKQEMYFFLLWLFNSTPETHKTEQK